MTCGCKGCMAIAQSTIRDFVCLLGVIWSFGVISIAAVAGAEEKLGIGVNDRGGHNFQICWLWSCDWFTKGNVGGCFRLCRIPPPRAMSRSKSRGSSTTE